MASSGEGQLNTCHTIEEWNEKLKEGKDSGKLVVAYFTATWCPPCRFIGPVVAEFAGKHSNALFLKVDVDDLKTVAEEWDVEAMPTFIFIKEGKVVERVVGADKLSLGTAILKHDSVVTA